MKRCSRCGLEHPVTEFWKNSTTPDGLARWCKDCANTKKRDATPDRIARNRARHRARARLADMFPHQYRALYDAAFAAALDEVGRLGDVVGGQPVRLRTGARREGQTVVDRIDVAWCVECHHYHDAGHKCPTCSDPKPETREERLRRLNAQIMADRDLQRSKSRRSAI